MKVASMLPKNLWLRRLVVATLVIFSVGIAVKARALGGTRTLPYASFDPKAVDIGAAQQVVVVRSKGWLDTTAVLEAMEWDGDSWNTVVGPISANLGRSGFALARREGDGSTPAGVFAMTEAFGLRQKPDGTKLKYESVNDDDWWISDPDSPHYNTWQHGPSAGRWREWLGEDLSSDKYATAYRHAVVIDYNRDPIIPGAGSAIFLHVDGGRPTSGCVAIEEAALRKILQWLDPALGPRIVMGPESWLLAPIDAPLAPLEAAVGLASLPPARVLDTRTGQGARQGPLGPQTSIELQIRGTAGVPAEAQVVALNLTATEPTLETYLRVTPTGTPEPTVSNLNVHAGGERANLVLARVGPDGRVRVYNHAGSTHVVADVVGYGSPTTLGGVTLVPPRRVLDTRSGDGVSGGFKDKLASQATLDVLLPGTPPGATAAIVNLPATDPTETTHLAAYAGGAPWPNTSTLNLKRGETIPNLAIVPLSPDRRIRIRNNAGSVNVVADLFGFVVASGGSRYRPATQPARVLDTREGIGRRGQVATGTKLAIEPPGAPATVTGAVFNLTGVNATAPTNLRAWRAGVDELPLISSVNLAPDIAAANLVVSQTDLRGGLQIYNSQGNLDVLADLQGWFVS